MNRKWDIEKVRFLFQKQNCALLSKEYKNVSTPLEYVASCGHKHKISLNNFLAGKGRVCKKCRYDCIAENKTQNYKDVKIFFEQSGCVLLSETYEGCFNKLEYVAQCGHKNVISFAKFKRGSGRVCRRCSKAVKYEYEDVFEFFLREGCCLLDTEYINCKQPLRFIAQCGHESSITLDAFLNSATSRNCKDCQKITHFNITKIKELFQKYNCEVLDLEYISKRKINYIASCGHEHKILLSKFLNGQGVVCPKCAIPRGENHFAYNFLLSDEERIKNRDFTEYFHWRKMVFERDEYRCIHCFDDKGGNLVAHHLNSYNAFPEQRLLIENGVTLCESCHGKFHRQYGFGNNTKEQFQQWNGNTEVSLRIAKGRKTP